MTDESVADDIRSPLSTTLLTVVGTVLVALVVYGLVVLVSVLMRDERTVTSAVDLEAGAPLVLDVSDVDVTVSSADVDRVTLTATVTDGLLDTSYAVGEGPRGLVVESSCMAWLSPGCGAELEVRVPSGTPVAIASTEGDLTLHDLSASGAVTLRSASGDVDASGLDIDELDVRTDTGDVDLVFEQEPYAVKVATDEGDVEVVLPAGGRMYQVAAESDDGDVQASVTGERGGEGLIRLTSRTGDIALFRE